MKKQIPVCVARVMCTGIFYRIGNCVSYTTKASGRILFYSKAKGTENKKSDFADNIRKEEFERKGDGIMKPDMMKRCLILLAVLVVCAGAAWYFTNASAKPAEDAVLAYFQGDMNVEKRNTAEVGLEERQEDMELPERQDGVWTEKMYGDGGAKVWQAKSCI